MPGKPTQGIGDSQRADGDSADILAPEVKFEALTHGAAGIGGGVG